MSKLTKKQKALEGKVDSTKLYPLVDAIGIVKEAESLQKFTRKFPNAESTHSIDLDRFNSIGLRTDPEGPLRYLRLVEV